MPLSRDADARARQLANLARGPIKPFHEGNTAALVHGLRSRATRRELLDPYIRELEEDLGDCAPVVEAGKVPAADRFMVRLAAQALYNVECCEGWLYQHGRIDAHGQPRIDVLRMYDAAIGRADKMLDRLGMNPQSRSRMKLELVRAEHESLELELAAGKAARAARQAEQAERQAVVVEATEEATT